MILNLTEGKPEQVLRRFTIPLFVSVIFQQMYNIADSVIAGKFAGEDALAAVGASYPISMIFMAVAIGSNIGCSVIISGLFGAKEYKNVKTAVGTTLITTVTLGGILCVIGLTATDQMMHMIHTPQDIFSDSALYLRIYFYGFLFVYLYNVATGIFTSLGDSKTPLYFLIGSSIGNILLDMLFVINFHWGVAGVAWATFIAQGAACILALITLKIRLKQVKCDSNYARFSFPMLKKISLVAIPSILQQSFISIGNIAIQGLVNSCGAMVIAGYSAAIKLNTFTITSFTTLSNGMSNFTAQNLGAGKKDRVEQGFHASLRLAFTIGLPFILLFFFVGEPLIAVFLKERSEEALHTGVTFLKIVSPFYLVIAIKLMADGVLRGSQSMKQFMIATFSDLILRVLLAFALFPFFKDLGIWLSWPFGWIAGMAVSYYFYRKFKENGIEEL